MLWRGVHMLEDESNLNNVSVSNPSVISRILRIEWLGQTLASLCWIASVFAYGISSAGDFLQLLAASSWLIANIASLITFRRD